jgi:hypothetical protein
VFPRFAEIAQLVEHVHGKDGVVGSIPTLGSKIKPNSFLPISERAARKRAKLGQLGVNGQHLLIFNIGAFACVEEVAHIVVQ